MTDKGYISKYGGNSNIPLTVFDLLMYQICEQDIKIVKNGEIVAEGTQNLSGLSPNIQKFGNYCVKKISHKYSGAYLEIGDDVRTDNL